MGATYTPFNGTSGFLVSPYVNIGGPGNAVANTTTQTSLFTGATFRPGQSLLIPSNTLMPGSMIEFTLFGTFGCTSSTPQLTFSLNVGGVTAAQSEPNSISAAVTNGEWYCSNRLQVHFPEVGSSGAMFAVGALQAVLTPSGNVLSTWPLYSGNLVGTGSLIAINTTVPIPIDFLATWGTANAANTIQLLGGMVTVAG
jgi:hypothetical protein